MSVLSTINLGLSSLPSVQMADQPAIRWHHFGGAAPSSAAQPNRPAVDTVTVRQRPQAAAPQKPDTETKSASDGTTYVVRPGDTLGAIAKRLLGSTAAWSAIYAANRDKLSDPNRIVVGQKLVIPGASAAPAPEPARKPTPQAPVTQAKPRVAPTQPASPPPVGVCTTDFPRMPSPEELRRLGKTDKQAFLEALRPAARLAECRYGVPAAITLAQAALESGWGSAPIGGFNIFGVKGEGTAGSLRALTFEHINGHNVSTKQRFALYSNWEEAIMEHAKVFHNPFFQPAIDRYKADGNLDTFVTAISRHYATAPSYAGALRSIIRDYGLDNGHLGDAVYYVEGSPKVNSQET
jgi:murein DD-endopeptidase MepM/ murein hydrolase activator NlpD